MSPRCRTVPRVVLAILGCAATAVPASGQASGPRSVSEELALMFEADQADDSYHAAMIMQHGDSAEDALLAHILATAAGFDGHREARWLSAAALDRYLHRTREPQRFGTQYVRVRRDEPIRLDPSAPWSQGPCIRRLPDDVRSRYGVRPLADQRRWVADQNAPGARPGS